MLANTIVALALFAGAVSAQYNATYVDPTTVDEGLKASWCNGQENVCLTLCSKSVNNNTCDPTTLTYNCLCKSNNSSPDLADYKTSLAAFICQQSYADCIKLYPNNQEGQDNCTTNIEDKCGTLDITNFTAPATSSSAAATGSPTSAPSSAGAAEGTASSSAASTSPTKNAAAAALIVGREYGSGIIAAVFVAAFGFMV